MLLSRVIRKDNAVITGHAEEIITVVRMNFHSLPLERFYTGAEVELPGRLLQGTRVKEGTENNGPSLMADVQWIA